MLLSTPARPTPASPPAAPRDVWLQQLPAVEQLVHDFRRQPPTPQATHDFETALWQRLHGCGRALVEHVFNDLEPDALSALPAQIVYQGTTFRRRPKSPRRALDSLFGPIRLRRYGYEPVDERRPMLFPLEMALGIEAERATPALAERIGQWSASSTQSAVRAVLARDHNVRLSVTTLRKVTAAVSAGMAEHREAAQAAKIQQALAQAAAEPGPHRPTVCAGRDGVMVPLRGRAGYGEAATATVSVLDRRGRRRYTAYLGRMPEKGQKALSAQLTGLLVRVLALVPLLPLRWQYVTDGGHHQREYFRRVLRRLCHPLTGKPLAWEWVIDFYHVGTYVSKLAEALHGLGKAGTAWAAKMRHWLRHKPKGILRVMHSAAALYSRWELTRAEEEQYDAAWGYLSKRKRRMDYAAYRRRGLAIGSGVTEAACKTVFSQRLKLSGMRWEVEGGQVIVDLRVIWLSQVWGEVHAAYLASKPQLDWATLGGSGVKMAEKAA
jgi:hypothetical protein